VQDGLLESDFDRFSALEEEIKEKQE